MNGLLKTGCLFLIVAGYVQAMPLGVRTAVWGHTAATRLAAPVPDLGMNPSPAVIAYVLGEAVDGKLAANITDPDLYAAFRTWALEAGTIAAKESPFAWRSFALGADTVISEELGTGDVVIESFGPLDRGRFECVVRIEGVGVRKGAVSAETFGANVGKVLVFEGAETLDPDTFTVDAVETVLGIPKDGKGVFTLWPKDPVRSFFVRARVK